MAGGLAKIEYHGISWLPACSVGSVRLSSLAAGYWRKGVYRKDGVTKVGLLTQPGVIMVRYTGTINANRH